LAKFIYLAKFIWRLYSPNIFWRNLFGEIYLAKFIWRNLFGEQFRKHFWRLFLSSGENQFGNQFDQIFFGKINLANIFGQKY
jgi:hypothetical protein